MGCCIRVKISIQCSGETEPKTDKNILKPQISQITQISDNVIPQIVYFFNPDNRSTDHSTSSGCSAVHGESVEPSRRSLRSSVSRSNILQL